jgi:hypothetical protein
MLRLCLCRVQSQGSNAAAFPSLDAVDDDAASLAAMRARCSSYTATISFGVSRGQSHGRTVAASRCCVEDGDANSASCRRRIASTKKGLSRTTRGTTQASDAGCCRCGLCMVDSFCQCALGSSLVFEVVCLDANGVVARFTATAFFNLYTLSLEQGREFSLHTLAHPLTLEVTSLTQDNDNIGDLRHERVLKTSNKKKRD